MQEMLTQTKVYQHELGASILARKEKVLKLQIAMNDTFIMTVANCCCHLFD
jgi:hypothetical protein